MGWSTKIVVANKWEKDEKLCWETFNEHSIEIIEWNKTYLVCNYFSDLDYFKEERYELEQVKLDVDDNSRYTGWYCSNLNSDLILKLLEKEEVEKFVNHYGELRPFKTKTERNKFKKKYVSALKVCLYFLTSNNYKGVYIVEG